MKNNSGRTDYIFSAVKDENVVYNTMSVNATYAVVTQQGKDFTLFLGNGKSIEANGFAITSAKSTFAVLEYRNGAYYFTCEDPVVLVVNGREIKWENVLSKN